MRTRLVLLVIAVAACAAVLAVSLNRQPPAAATESKEPVDSKLVAADTVFGLKLLRQLVDEARGGNVFISPASVALALTMTYNGAGGDTQEAMAKALELQGMSLEQVNKANAALLANLNGPGPGVALSVANSLWAREGAEFRPDFLQRNEEFYKAEVRNLDFGSPDAPDTINKWVSDKTNGRIKDIIRDIGDTTVMFLINAVYFKGEWQEKFDPAKTRDGTFTLADGTKKTVQMMTRHGDMDYFETDTFQAVRLPYGKGRVSMYVFLPRVDSSLAAFYKELTAENWKKWMSSFHETEGDLTLPKLRLEYEADLKDALSALGMGIAFGAAADFRDMSPADLYIKSVKHKTFVEVNEEGTEAAAATSVEMAVKAIAVPLQVIVDRPFFFAIRDDKTGVVLFMGSIMDPTK